MLDWNGSAEYLVPGTLDGVAIGFGELAFRARGRPHRTRPTTSSGPCCRTETASSAAEVTSTSDRQAEAVASGPPATVIRVDAPNPGR